MKEDDKGIRFHTLLTAGVYCGGRISPEKLRRRFCSVLFLGGSASSRGGGGRAGQGGDAPACRAGAQAWAAVRAAQGRRSWRRRTGVRVRAR
jgi:hypothetical protein